MSVLTSVAIVHDFLTQRGGAERVVLQLLSTFPGAPVFTSLYDPAGTFPELAHAEVRASRLQHRVQPEQFRRAVLAYPKAFREMDLRAYDVVVVSSSAFAHHVRHPNAHVYCHTPPRFLYAVHSYYDRRFQRLALRPALTMLRRGDRRAARAARSYVANSRATRDRIARAYGLRARIIHPPLRTGHLPDEVCAPRAGAGALVVARLLPYKRVDVAVRACAMAGIPLTVVGEGPELERLQAIAPPSTTFAGQLTDPELAEAFVEHAVVLVPGVEDFGYLPVEAAYAGRPVIAFAEGGALETVHAGVNGALVANHDPASWAASIHEVLGGRWSPAALRVSAEPYLAPAFDEAVRRWVSGAPATLPSCATPS